MSTTQQSAQTLTPAERKALPQAAPVRRCYEAMARIGRTLEVCSALAGAIVENDARAYDRALTAAPGVGLDAADMAEVYATACRRFAVTPDFGPAGCQAVTACDECGAEPGEPCRPHCIATEQ